MHLNNKGQCPVCLMKPLIYKRDALKYCTRCQRDFDINTGEFLPGNSWSEPNIATERFAKYGSPRYALDKKEDV